MNDYNALLSFFSDICKDNFEHEAQACLSSFMKVNSADIQMIMMLSLW